MDRHRMAKTPLRGCGRIAALSQVPAPEGPEQLKGDTPLLPFAGTAITMGFIERFHVPGETLPTRCEKLRRAALLPYRGFAVLIVFVACR
jgi:hypothetical protein